jgi:hypothetical protein
VIKSLADSRDCRWTCVLDRDEVNRIPRALRHRQLPTNRPTDITEPCPGPFINGRNVQRNCNSAPTLIVLWLSDPRSGGDRSSNVMPEPKT